MLLFLLPLLTFAQSRFFNLTRDQVKIDSMLPHVAYTLPLGGAWADSTYSARIAYPDFIDATEADVAAYRRLTGDDPAEGLPTVSALVTMDRKQPALQVGLCPLVKRGKNYKWLVSFMLQVEARAKTGTAARVAKARVNSNPAERYAAHSVLSEGRWAKISVPDNGVYQLSQEFIRRAGFSDLSRVRIFGYGGHLQPEALSGDYLAATDDLQELPTTTINGRRLFYGQGPVSWSSATATTRTRNPYANEGCYFITETDGEPLTVDSAAFVASFYPLPEFYHDLYENDSYAFMHGGRNLFDASPIAAGATHTVVLDTPRGEAYASGDTQLTVVLAAAGATTATVSVNGVQATTLSLRTPGTYDHGVVSTRTVTIALSGTGRDTIAIVNNGSAEARLDYIQLAYAQPKALPTLGSSTIATPTYLYGITNQDHHADPQADMVIIIPTSQKLLAQAQRIKSLHEQSDGMTVSIVPADELFNEFASGTPDANAYRRYLKMLYDRASSDSDMPKHLLLFGDAVWDNRMLSTTTRQLSADDYLLCFESENSNNQVASYVDDCWFALLDDGEGADPLRSDKPDIGVGRFPVVEVSDAKTMVDKTIAYAQNSKPGVWQNTLMFMGDDGNNNIHMDDANAAAEQTLADHPGYLVKKVMWDAYERVATSTGNTYPEATRIIKAQQQAGALVMDYVGHGSEVQISHEGVLKLADFADFTNTNLPLWITASCDIMPFDSNQPTIGETALLNKHGGAVAFFGTTRTVYANYNRAINMAFLRHVLSTPNGKPMTLGEAQRLAKGELITTGADLTYNKMQYSLLGDPALQLKLPTAEIVVDSINHQPVSAAAGATLLAGQTATLSGYVEGYPAFEGTVSLTVRDTEETIVGRLNNTTKDGAQEAFAYNDRLNTLYAGQDSVRAGRFSITFALPRDINYSDGTGLATLYALSSDRKVQAHGANDAFAIAGSDLADNDSIGPSVYCYLNSPQFVNGGQVNTTPYFVAEIYDRNGINASGAGVGHNLELVVDGEMSRTYNLNDYFTFDFGSYTRGTTRYSLPALEAGKHELLFRAWDVLGNSSATLLNFEVVEGLQPQLFDVSATRNPATTETTFIVATDRAGATLDVEVELFDMAGRLLWKHTERGVAGTDSYAIDWDLTTDTGATLRTGVYIYRVNVSENGSTRASKAKKLIILRNN